MPLRKRDDNGEELLTIKEEAFVSHYIANGGNGFQAAKSAGYSPDSGYAIASENLRKPQIARRIHERIAEATNLTSSEIIGTLASHMRVDITDFLDERGEVDIDRIREQGHLVKRLKVRRTYQGKGKDKLVTETVEIELHDAQAAAFKLASLMGLENWQYTDGGAIEVKLLEKERTVLTSFMQRLLDHGWTVKLALEHLREMNIPDEKLKLIRGEDLRIPEAIAVGRD
jgi:phage terminase small subunit